VIIFVFEGAKVVKLKRTSKAAPTFYNYMRARARARLTDGGVGRGSGGFSIC